MKAERRTDCISVVIPVKNRFHYAIDIVNSIHQHADFPFEIILHDDGSDDGETPKLLFNNIRNKVTLLMFNSNPPWSIGYAASVERCIKLATSEYIIVTDPDCIVVKPCFKDIINILHKSYIGYINLGNPGSATEYFKANGTPFNLGPGIGGGSNVAFRKSKWEEIGGHLGEFGTCTMCGDIRFMSRMIEAGYFRASIAGPAVFHNVSRERMNAGQPTDSTIMKGEMKDCSLPQLFKCPDYERLSRARYDAIQSSDKKKCNTYGKELNINYLTDMTQFIGLTKVDWKNRWNDNCLVHRETIDNEEVYKVED